MSEIEHMGNSGLLLFLLLAKKARERHGTSFVFSLLMKCGGQGMHVPFTLMRPRCEVENVILNCGNLRRHGNLVCSPESL